MQSENVRKYISLKTRMEEEDCDEIEANKIEEEMEELYFDLSDSEIEFLEIKEHL